MKKFLKLVETDTTIKIIIFMLTLNFLNLFLENIQLDLIVGFLNIVVGFCLLMYFLKKDLRKINKGVKS